MSYHSNIRVVATAKVRRIDKAGFRKRLLTTEFTRPENNVLNLRDRLRFPCWRWNWVTIGRACCVYL